MGFWELVGGTLDFVGEFFPENFLWQTRDLKTEPSPPLRPWGLSLGEGGYGQGSWGPDPTGVAMGMPHLTLCHYFFRPSLIFTTSANPNKIIGTAIAIIISAFIFFILFGPNKCLGTFILFLLTHIQI